MLPSLELYNNNGRHNSPPRFIDLKLQVEKSAVQLGLERRILEARKYKNSRSFVSSEIRDLKNDGDLILKTKIKLTNLQIVLRRLGKYQKLFV